jgi:hypothetical protein
MNKLSQVASEPGTVAIFCEIRAQDTFGDAAQALLTLVQEAARRFPGQARHLHLDISGHTRPGTGGYDDDVSALLTFFVPEVMGRWLARWPAADDGPDDANPAQRDDVPDGIVLVPEDRNGERWCAAIGLDGITSFAGGKTVLLVAVRSGATLAPASRR